MTKVADSVLPQEILSHQMKTWQELISNNHSRTPHCPYPFAPVSQYYKLLQRQKKLKLYTENKRAVAGVGTAILRFGIISCFAFSFDKNNLGQGGKKDVMVTNIQGDPTALDYKLE